MGSGMDVEDPRTVDVDDLFRRSKAGDAAALNELCDHCFKWLSRWGHRRLPDWARARFSTPDLVQVTLMRALERLDRFEPAREDALLGFLTVVFKNALTDEIRYVQRQGLRVPEEEATDNSDGKPSQYEVFFAKRAYERTTAALKGLSTTDQSLICARERGDSFKEIAAQEGLPSPDAARMAFNRAVKRLETAML